MQKPAPTTNPLVKACEDRISQTGATLYSGAKDVSKAEGRRAAAEWLAREVWAVMELVGNQSYTNPDTD